MGLEPTNFKGCLPNCHRHVEGPCPTAPSYTATGAVVHHERGCAWAIRIAADYGVVRCCYRHRGRDKCCEDCHEWAASLIEVKENLP